MNYDELIYLYQLLCLKFISLSSRESRFISIYSIFLRLSAILSTANIIIYLYNTKYLQEKDNKKRTYYEHL